MTAVMVIIERHIVAEVICSKKCEANFLVFHRKTPVDVRRVIVSAKMKTIGSTMAIRNIWRNIIKYVDEHCVLCDVIGGISGTDCIIVGSDRKTVETHLYYLSGGPIAILDYSSVLVRIVGPGCRSVTFLAIVWFKVPTA